MIKKIVALTFLLALTKQAHSAVKQFENFVKNNPTAEQLAAKIDSFSTGTSANTFKAASSLISGPDADAYDVVYNDAFRALKKGEKRNTQLALEKFRKSQQEPRVSERTVEIAPDIDELLRQLELLKTRVIELDAEQTRRMRAAGI